MGIFLVGGGYPW